MYHVFKLHFATSPLLVIISLCFFFIIFSILPLFLLKWHFSCTPLPHVPSFLSFIPSFFFFHCFFSLFPFFLKSLFIWVFNAFFKDKDERMVASRLARLVPLILWRQSSSFLTAHTHLSCLLQDGQKDCTNTHNFC